MARSGITSLRRSLVAAVLLVLTGLAARGEEPKQWEQVGWRLVVENDSFPGGTDRNYTQGVKVEVWLAGPDVAGPRLIGDSRFKKGIGKWCDALSRTDSYAPCLVDVGFGFGQTIYTPTEITVPTPQPDDHPWGGYLFLASSLVVSTATWYHSLEVQAGVVGPSAQAQWAQSAWHRIVNADHPEGWSNQIRNELAVQALYTFRGRWGGDHLDAIFEGAGGVGTVQDFIRAGATIRIGAGLRGFGKGGIGVPAPVAADAASDWKSLSGGQRDPSKDSGRRPSGPHVFFTSMGRWIPFDTFLRGGTFNRVPTNIEQHDFTWDGRAGVVFPLSTTRRWNLAVEQIWRSPAFDDGRWQRFVSIAVSRTSRAVMP